MPYFRRTRKSFPLLALRTKLAELSGLAVSSFEAVDRLISKANFSRLLTELDIPQPETTIVTTAMALAGPWDFPVYVKCALGTAGSGVRYISNEDELRTYIEQLESGGGLNGNLEYLVQRPAVGTHGSISAVFRDGELLGWHSCAARRLGVGGAPMAHVSTHHPVVVNYVRRIGEYLDWHGAAFFDFFVDGAPAMPCLSKAIHEYGKPSTDFAAASI